MAAAFQRRIGMSLPATQLHGEKRLVRPAVVVWVEGIGVGRSAGTQDYAIPDILVSDAEPVELNGIMTIKGKLKTNESRKQKWRDEKGCWIDTPKRCHSWFFTVHTQCLTSEEY